MSTTENFRVYGSLVLERSGDYTFKPSPFSEQPGTPPRETFDTAVGFDLVRPVMLEKGIHILDKVPVVAHVDNRGVEPKIAELRANF